MTKKLSRSERKAEREARQVQIEQRYWKQRQRNVMAKPGRYSFALVLDHLKAGYNVAKIFRSAEAFGAAAIYLVGIGPFDPAPAKGAFRKVPAHFFDDFESCHQQLREDGYKLFALDPRAEVSLPEHKAAANQAFILGHEEHGFSFDLSEYPDIATISIPQVGQVESLNVSIAASVLMYEYVRQHMVSGREEVVTMSATKSS